MPQDSSGTLYTVILTGVKGDSNRDKISAGLSKITRDIPKEDILRRMEQLPWTLTRKAGYKNAVRLVKFLEKLQAEVKVIPPLNQVGVSDYAETMILPETSLLSETQVMSSTQFISVPPDPPPPRSKPELIFPMDKTANPQQGPAQTETGSGEPPANNGEIARFLIEPLSLAEILDRTFQLCKTNFWKFFGILAIWWVGVSVMAIIGAVIFLIFGWSLETFTKDPDFALIAFAGIFGIVVVLALVVVMWLSHASLVYAAATTYTGGNISIKESYSRMWSKLGRLVLTYSLLVVVLIAGIAVMAVLAGVFWLIFSALTQNGMWSVIFWIPMFFLFAYCSTKILLLDKVVILEDLAYWEAIKRSWLLLSGKGGDDFPKSYYWRMMILMILFVILSMVINAIFEGGGWLLVYLIPFPQILAAVVKQVISNLGGLIGGIFGSVCMVIFYYDIRSRKEGFDLAQLSE